MMKNICVLGLFLCISLASLATTQIVTFSGNVNVLNNEHNIALPGVLDGHLFWGQLSYSMIPDQNPTSGVGQYSQISSIDLTIRTSDTKSVKLSYTGPVGVLVNDGAKDSFAFNATGNGENGYRFVNFDAFFEDNQGLAFNSDTLPVELTQTMFQTKYINLYGVNSQSKMFRVRCDIVAIESVSIPEPATLGLFIAGLVSLYRKK